MVALLIGESESLIEIASADSEIVRYTISRCPPGLDDWAVWLQRQDDERRYRVAVDRDGFWRCSCKDWRYRHRPSKTAGCKHVEAIRLVDGFINQLECET